MQNVRKMFFNPGKSEETQKIDLVYEIKKTFKTYFRFISPIHRFKTCINSVITFRLYNFLQDLRLLKDWKPLEKVIEAKSKDTIDIGFLFFITNRVVLQSPRWNCSFRTWCINTCAFAAVFLRSTIRQGQRSLSSFFLEIISFEKSDLRARCSLKRWRVGHTLK